jgi:hypothetical protein
LLNIAQGRVILSLFADVTTNRQRGTSRRNRIVAPIVSATFARYGISHETARTEIERFFNCRSFRSFLVSLRAIERQGISFDADDLNSEHP